jgi:hypothetical protein
MNTRTLNAQPWRFEPGEVVFVRGWAADDTALITGRAYPSTPLGFPHYLAVDDDGKEWLLPQIHLSHSPLGEVE